MTGIQYNFATILKEYLHAKRLKAIDFAKVLGKERGVVSNWQNGKITPSKSTMLMIYERFPDFPKDYNSNTIKPLEQTLPVGDQNRLVPYYKSDAEKLDYYSTLNEPATQYVHIPEFSDCDIALNYYGKAMEPVITAGEMIVARKMPNTEELSFGSMYLICTKANRVVRYVRKHRDEGKVMLKAANPDYDEFEVNKVDIETLLLVKGCVKRNEL